MKDGIQFRYNQTFGHWEYQIIDRNLIVALPWSYITRADLHKALATFVEDVEPVVEPVMS
jgi:hypothetical protein